MRISKLFIPNSKAQTVHLKEINLTKKALGPTVALIGKNGAGKTRLLNFVNTYIYNITTDEFLNRYITNIPKDIESTDWHERIKSAVNTKHQIETQIFAEAQKSQLRESIRLNIEPNLEKLRTHGSKYIKVISNDDLVLIKEAIANGVTFKKVLANKHKDKSNINDINEFSVFGSQSTIDYINEITLELVNDEFNLYLRHKEDPSSIKQKIEGKESFKQFANIKRYIEIFLGKEFSYQSHKVGREISSVLHFDGVPFNINLLSPGQKSLFAYAILFFFLDNCMKTNIRDSIIILDEPEKHLHPEAQIRLISSLKDIVKESGQLWIATHSINILAHLECDEILMMKDNGVILPSLVTPGNSYNELMGIEEHINELRSFVNSTSEWAYGNFMMQCFREPEIIFSNDTTDPEFKLFKQFITQESILEILDYGAGKGRMGHTIQEDCEVSIRVNYHAYLYEPAANDLEFIKKIPNIKGIYQDLKDIPDNYFDCVLLCNVLHEIVPDMWIENINQIKSKLKPNGYLVIIEDKYFRNGEKAHSFGYLILGSEQLKILFGVEDVIEFKMHDKKYCERILFNAYKKEQINPTEESLVCAIKSLEEESFNNIETMRNATQEINGSQYANQTQLYINAKLFLKAFNNKKTK